MSVASRPDETPPTGTPTTTTYAAEQIRNRIVLGILPPGSKVRVYELAEELGISRVPLREAVRELEAESLVDNLPRRGTIVRQLSEQDLRDSFALLRRIEPIAARRAAAEDGAVAREMRHWLKELRQLHRRRVARSSEEMLHAHRQFHFSMFAVSGEGVLQRHLEMLWNTCERYVMMSLPDHERQRAADREHARLVDAIAAGDPDLAVRALDDHLDNSLASCLSRLAEPVTGTG